MRHPAFNRRRPPRVPPVTVYVPRYAALDGAAVKALMAKLKITREEARRLVLLELEKQK